MRVAGNFVSWLTATVIIVSAILTVVLVTYYREGWQEVPAEGSGHKWIQGKITHFDRNGDGVVDEIVVELDKTNEFFIKRDSNLSGWFDLQYEIRSNIAVHIEKIHEKAPRH